MPDRLVAEGRFGVQIDEDPRLARARFEDVVTEVAVKDPWLRENRPVVTWPGGQFASGSTDSDHPLIGEMSSAVAAHRRRAAPARAPGSTAATCGSTPASAASRRCTTVPATSQDAHSPLEKVDLDQLVQVDPRAGRPRPAPLRRWPA